MLSNLSKPVNKFVAFNLSFFDIVRLHFLTNGPLPASFSVLFTFFSHTIQVLIEKV